MNAPNIYKNGRSSRVFFLSSLTESNHILILAVSPLHFSQSDKTVFDFKTILSSETSIIPYNPSILAHTEVSVYLTGFKKKV